MATTNRPSMGLARDPPIEAAVWKMLPNSPTRKASPIPTKPEKAAKRLNKSAMLV